MADSDARWPEGPATGPDGPSDQLATGVMRSWLVHGTRKFAIDKRRRFGRHGQSRRLLAADGARGPGVRGTLYDLVAALQRQAVHSALTQLRKADRQILTLAYLQGHSNREIAARLGVSVRTVSRRLTAALARVDWYVRQAGVWMISVAVVAFGYARAARWPGGLTAATAATAAVLTLGVVAIGPDTTLEPKRPAHRAPAVEKGLLRPILPAISWRQSSQPAATGVELTSVGRTTEPGSAKAAAGGPVDQIQHHRHKHHPNRAAETEESS